MNARNIFSRWTALGCAIACFAIGYGVARWTTPPAARQSRISTAAVTDENSAVAPFETPAPVEVSLEVRWRELSQRPACLRTTRERAAFLEDLARRDPQQALKLALAESNLLVRDELRAAALRGWAAVASDAAADWAMAQPVLGERMRCVGPVLEGAVENPGEAIRIALKLCEADPEPALAYGHELVNAMVNRAGDFESAVTFARSASMVEGQSVLVDSAYYQWAQQEPERLFAEIASLKDSESREAAMNGLIQGLANSDASTLAEYAKTLPEGDDRSVMFSAALPEWGIRDPDAALQWINEAGPHPDFDRGLSALAGRSAMSPDLNPLQAMELTDNITDSVMRGMAKSDIFLQWARADYSAAEKYARSVRNPEYREMYLGTLETAAAGD
jgi:hypothetical protein